MTKPNMSKQSGTKQNATKESREKLPHKSGYGEPHPLTNDRKKQDPDANTPHEPQNVPEKKPFPASG